MRGEILSFDAVTGMGQISGEDGQRYNFDRSGFPGLGAPRAGQRVDFVPSGDIATNIMAISADSAPGGATSGATAAYAPPPGAGIDWGKLFFSFDGRLRRSHFWIGWAIVFAVGFVLGLVIPFIGLILLWPHLALGVRRLHDMNRTGWLIAISYVGAFALVMVGIGIVGFGALANSASWENNPAAAMAVMGPGLAAFALAAVLQLGFFAWIGVTEGTRGENRFGPDPKGGVSLDTSS